MRGEEAAADGSSPGRLCGETRSEIWIWKERQGHSEEGGRLKSVLRLGVGAWVHV